jgi:HTH-type transcriptional regulator/antitoxin HigA
MKSFPKDLQTHWEAIAPLLTIRNEKEYDAAVKRLNELLDEIGTNEKNPLYSLLGTLGMLVHAYEEEHYPIDKFIKASRYVLQKNAKLYKRLSK